MLNNVEFAKQELDRLESSMQVEACAEIIRQAEGPKPPRRKPNKYNFTVKIVEAEDLKACDPNGFSDPYVVLVDERQKRLHKTRVVRKSLNPRWDESRDIAVTSPITIIATVWDDDMFGDHDFVGRTSFKLDPVHFSDYIPREIWLDLDTQGRVLVKVSMEGERDDIEFQFGKAFRDLKRTEQTMVRKITDKVRAFSRALSQSTSNMAPASRPNQCRHLTRDPRDPGEGWRHRCPGHEPLEEEVVNHGSWGDAPGD